MMVCSDHTRTNTNSQCSDFPTGSDPSKPTLVAIKGTVFDVSGNDAYGPKGQYHGQYTISIWDNAGLRRTGADDPLSTVFAGKDPSRALATSSLKAEDCVPEWNDLEDKYQTVLGEWFTFFSKRYNIVGKVQGATNK